MPPWTTVYAYFSRWRQDGTLTRLHAANVQDRDGAKLLLAKAKSLFPRLALLWADGRYAGKLVDWVKSICGWVLQIVKRSDQAKGFQLLPRRWVVERTFGWLGRHRRLSKDYERRTNTSEAMIYWAMTRLMVRRLAGATENRRLIPLLSAKNPSTIIRGRGCAVAQSP